MTVPPELKDLWQQHTASSFPKGYGGKEINRIDLALLDAEIAGCIRMYIHQDGKLDRQRVKTLHERLIDLNSIVLLMDQDELIYFDRLRKMADLVLLEVDKAIE